MGNTCSSVHIALTGTTPDAIKGIVRAYAMLGFERAMTAPRENGKHVILLRKEGDAFLSVYDSDNALLDTGELKDLALAASKIFKTAAVCTSLYDSDTFEVVVFNAGQQVDLVMSSWQPLFDHADDYHRTVYEEHSVLNWFRGILQNDSGLNASKMSLHWCRNVLRMVTPHVWICRALLQQVDRAALEAVAHVTEANDAFKIALREGRRLDDLELALLPILPVETARVHPVR